MTPSQQTPSGGLVVWGWISVAFLGWFVMLLRGPSPWTTVGGFLIVISVIATMLALLASQTWRLRRWFGPVDWRGGTPALLAALLALVGLWALGWLWWRAVLVALLSGWALAAVSQVARALRARDAAAASE